MVAFSGDHNQTTANGSYFADPVTPEQDTSLGWIKTVIPSKCEPDLNRHERRKIASLLRKKRKKKTKSEFVLL